MPDNNPTPSKVQKFYEILVGNGLTPEDIGDFPTFHSALTDEESRGRLFKNLKDRNLNPANSFEEFNSAMTQWYEDDRQGEKATAREAIGQTRQEAADINNQAVRGAAEAIGRPAEETPWGVPTEPIAKSMAEAEWYEAEKKKRGAIPTPQAVAIEKELTRAEKTLDAPEKKDVQGVIGAGKAFGQGISSMEVEEYLPVISGVTEAGHQKTLATLSAKIEKGEPLSLADSMLAKAAGLNTQAQSVSDVSNWFTGGQTTGAMLPFMGEMAATAGVGGAASKMVQAGMKARTILQGTNIASKIARGTIKSLSYATAQTPLQSMLYSEYERNKAGQYSLSVNPESGEIAGELVPGSVQSDPKAAYNAFTSTLMETWSEGLGEYGPKFVAKMIGKAGTSKGAKLLTTTFRKAAKFDGPGWQIGEEFSNALGIAALQGDTEQLEQMFTKDGFIQTAIPVAVVSGAFKVLEAGEKTAVRLNIKSNLSHAEKDMQELDTEDRNQIIQAAGLMREDPGKAQSMLNGIGQNLTSRQKVAVVKYMAAKLQSDLFNKMNEEDKANHLQQSVAQAVAESRTMQHRDGNYYQVTDKEGTPFYVIGGDMSRTPSIDNPIVVVDNEGNRKMITEPVTVARKMNSQEHDAYLYDNIAGMQQQQEAELEQVDAEAATQAQVEAKIAEEAAKRQILPGMKVEFNGQKATVQHISIQGAALEDEEGNQIIVPPTDIKQIKFDKEATRKASIEMLEDKFGVTINENIDTGNGNPTVDITPNVTIADPDMQLLNTQRVEELLAQEGIKVRNSVVKPQTQAAAPTATPETLPPTQTAPTEAPSTVPPTAQTEAQAPALPMNKQGEIQYDQINDPAIFAQALTQEFGEEAGAVADELLAEQIQLLNKAATNKNAIDRRRKSKVIQAQVDKLTAARQLLGASEVPTSEAPAAQAPEAPVNETPLPNAEQEIESNLGERGFKKSVLGEGVNDGNTGFTNGVYELTDAKPLNVLKDESGVLHYIDLDANVSYREQGEQQSEPKLNTQTNEPIAKPKPAGAKRTRKTKAVAEVVESEVEAVINSKDAARAAELLETVEAATDALLTDKPVDESFEAKWGVSVEAVVKIFHGFDGKNADLIAAYELASKNTIPKEKVEEFYADILEALGKERIKLKYKIYHDFREEVIINTTPTPATPIKKKGVESLSGMVSTDELRTAMTGVFVDEGNYIATDANKLVVVKKTESDETVIELLKAAATKEISKYANAKTTASRVAEMVEKLRKEGLSGKIINLKKGEVIDANYPKYKLVIPNDPDFVTKKFPIDNLIAMANGVVLAFRNVSPTMNGIVLSFNGPSNENTTANFNAIYLLATLQALKANGVTTISLEGSEREGRALMIIGNNGAKGLIMPYMRSVGGDQPTSQAFQFNVAPPVSKKKAKATTVGEYLEATEPKKEEAPKPTPVATKKPHQMTYDEYMQAKKTEMEAETRPMSADEFYEVVGRDEFLREWEQVLVSAAEKGTILSNDVLDSYVSIVGKDRYFAQFRGRSEQSQYEFRNTRAENERDSEENKRFYEEIEKRNASPVSDATAKGAKEDETKPKEDEKKVTIIPNGTTAFDKQAQVFIKVFLGEIKADDRVKFADGKTDYDMFAVMSPIGKIIALAKSPAEAYTAALNTDNETFHIVRETRANGAVTYDYYTGGLFGDYNENDLYDEAGKLKQEVKDAAIGEIKKHFKIEPQDNSSEKPNSSNEGNSPVIPDGSKQPWEMTRAEFVKEKDISSASYSPESNKQPKLNTYKEGDYSMDSSDDPYIYEFRMIDPNSVDYSEKWEREDVVLQSPNVQKYIQWFKEGKKPVPITVIFNQPTKTYKSSNRRRLLAAREAGVKIPAFVEIGKHKDIIKQALSEGKPVPAEVLADYPELQIPNSQTANGKPDGSKEQDSESKKQEPIARKKTERPADYGKKNIIVTEDAKNAALERLRKKRGNLNVGIDPQVLSDGITIASYHVESGLRKFSEWATAVLEDVGEWAIPYLKSWYNGVRDYPGMEQYEKDMTPYDQVKSFDLTTLNNITTFTDEQTDEQLNPQEDVSDRSGDRQPDGQDSEDKTPTDATDVQDDGGPGKQKGDGTPRKNNKGNGRQHGGKSGSGLFSSLFGESSDNDLHQEDEQPITQNDDAGDFDGRGNDTSSIDGHSLPDGRAGGSNISGSNKSFKEQFLLKQEQQKKVETVPVITGDIANIRETLPVLLPEQQDDVLKAEQRFFGEKHQTAESANGKGMLFTNGTGTGKTFTGLGIIKRFIKSGKKNILIVAPSENKVNDWPNDGKSLGLEIVDLENTKDAGTGVRVTTYANFRNNQALLAETFDLIVLDESHRIMEDKNGTASTTTDVFQMMGNVTPRDAFSRITSVHPIWIEHRELLLKYRNLNQAVNNDQALFADKTEKEIQMISNRLDELKEEIDRLTPEIKEQAEKAHQNTKVVLLSATPFKTVFNLRYVQDVLFNWGNETTYEQASRGASRVDAESRFFLTHFGSSLRWRYHRLEINGKANPEAVAMQEVAFAEKLMADGVMSGRAIESNKDYSREFPLVTLGQAENMNKAFAQIFDYSTEAQFPHLREAARDVFFDYAYTTQLLESLRASMVLDRIDQHLSLGRKVVVFHRRKQANIESPFTKIVRETKQAANSILADENSKTEDVQKAHETIEQVERFEREFKDLFPYEQSLSYKSAIELIESRFGDKVVTLNGDTKKSDKPKNVKAFNDDNSNKDIIVIQEEAGKEGISLHDTSGEHQRVLINLSIPISSTTALQTEGRIFRIGQESDAIFEYPLLGLDFEISDFGNKVNKKLSTTENLAVGNQSRDLLRSFAEGVMFNSTREAPSTNQGKGGKEYDKRVQESITEFRKAVLTYHTNQKKRGRRDQREGVDYYATPEPVGQKMVEWLDLEEGDSVLEPSAGHGAISMWFPESSNATVIEPSYSLFSKLGIRTSGNKKLINGTFESFSIMNKFTGVAMNPPFGHAGKMAADHVEKAFSHIKTGGRIVALIPVGAMDMRMNKFFQENPSARLVAEIKMPSVTFEQAGTSVNTRIVVIDKVSRKTKPEIEAELKNSGMYDDPAKLTEKTKEIYLNQGTEFPSTIKEDLSDANTIEELFDGIENIEMPERVKENKEQPDSEGEKNSSGKFILETVKHTKTGADMVIARMNTRLEYSDYKRIEKLADKYGGYRNKYLDAFHFTGKNAIEDRAKFVKEVDHDIRFSLERTPPTHPTIHDAKIDALRDLSEKAQNARPTFVSGTYEDLMAQMGANNEPAAFIKAVLEQIAMGNKIQAFMGQHGVYFVAANINDAEQARKLWIHEQGTHVGLRLLFNDAKALDTFLNKVFNMLGEEAIMEAFGGILQAYVRRDKAGNITNKVELAEEYMARLSEKVVDGTDLSAKEKTIWSWLRDRLMNLIRKFANDEITFKSQAEADRFLSEIIRQSVREVVGSKPNPQTTNVPYSDAQPNKARTVGEYLTDPQFSFSPTQIKSATANDGTFDGQNPDIRFAILGEKGAASLDKAEEATTRMDNLKVAREMETADKDAKTIRLATGWERGKDGLWRYEVPDGRLKKGINVGADIKHERFSAYEQDMVSTMLDDVWVDNELFKAYPQTLKIKVQITDEGSSSYSDDTKTITISKEQTDNPDDLSTVLAHEIQHAIQEIEGFARGGSATMFTKSRDNIQRLFKDIENAFDKLGYDAWLRDGGTVDNSQSRNFNGMYSFAETQKESVRDKMVSKLDEANKVINENKAIFGKVNIYDNIKDDELYKRLAGEVESRNVQSRMNLTPEERRTNLLSETEDVAREDQIILMDAIGGERNKEGDIRFSIAPDMEEIEPDNDWVKSNNTNRIIKRQLFQDNMIIGQRLIDEFKARGGKTNELTDFVSEHNKQNSRSMFEIRQYDEKYFKPMLEAIATVVKKYDMTVTELNDYLLAKHSIERHDAGVSALSEEPGTEWSREYVQSLVDAFEAKVPEAEREVMYAAIRKATMFSIEKLYSTGTMLPETYDRIKDQYKYYVPLRDWAKPETGEDPYPDEIFGYVNPSSRYNKHNSPLIKAKGRMSKSEDPLGFIQSLAHSAVTFGNKNEVRRAALRLLQANKDEHQTWPLAWQKKVWYVREPGGVWEETLEKPSAEKIAASKEAKAEYKRLARKLKRAEKNGEETDTLETIAGEMELIGENITVESRVLASHAARKPASQYKQHEVEVYDNGVKHVMVFADPRIAEALNGMDMYWKLPFWKKPLSPDTSGFLSEAIGRPTRWLTQNFTAKNPAFIPVNWIRDYTYAATSHLIRDLTHTVRRINNKADYDPKEAGNLAGFVKNTGAAVAAIHRYQAGKTNPVEDEMEQMTLADEAGREAFIKKYGKSRYNDTMYLVWMKGGGETGYVHMKTPDQLKLDAIHDLNKLLGRRTKGDYSKGKVKAVATDVKSSLEMIGEKAYVNAALKHSGHALNYLANMSENMSRFATFMASMEDGKTFGQATMDSKNITTNFNRRGRATSFIAPLYGFVNANIQGGHNLLHIARHNKKGFALASAMIMASGMLATEMVMALMSGDDDEKDIPDYVLLNNIVIPTGGGDYISIPLMPGFRMFWAAGVLAAQGLHGKKSMGDVIFKTTNSIAESFSPFTINESEWKEGQIPARAIIPTATVPFYDWAVNSNFTGKPVRRKRWNEYTPDSELGMRRTSQVFKDLAVHLNKLAGGDESRSAIYSIRKDGSVERAEGPELMLKGAMDFNPSVMEHVLLYYAGGRGRFFNDLRVSAGKLLQGEAPETYQIPVIKRLYGSAWDYETTDKWFDYADFVKSNQLFRKKAEAAENFELFDKLGNSEKTNELIETYDFYKEKMDAIEELIDAETDEKAKKELLKERATKMGEAVKEMDAINDKYKN